ncbi:tripartite tricarboxylate transporter TctB family protein [Gemmatimonadota bacterium Y43]|uniref:tripartite tricarboxylate transporter TctB family protein n=1 Tax=Gaopeijia maritima TaxID=3119007 RepID=UPI00327AF60F
MTVPRDRAWGIALVAFGVATAALALRFRVAFVTDPLGPRAFPWLASGFLVFAGIALFRRPGDHGPWPEAPVRRRLLLLVAVLVAWSALLPWLGFVLPTAGATGALARLFGAPWTPGLAAGTGLALALHLLFVFALGFPIAAWPWG